ncbi:MAG TPA: hypothetical protein VK530_15305 [Candidatus Acidoferrum sp.]|nr:hypothetical protein [Candidatus Acidoferrum sp.]
MTPEPYFNCEWIDLAKVKFTPELLQWIPADVARKYQVIPTIDHGPWGLSVAIADPSDLDAIDAVYFIIKREIQLCVADPAQLKEFIQRLY